MPWKPHGSYETSGLRVGGINNIFGYVDRDLILTNRISDNASFRSSDTYTRSLLLSLISTMDWDLISSYVGLLSLATVSIYAGAFGSLPVCDQRSVSSTKLNVRHRKPLENR